MNIKLWTKEAIELLNQHKEEHIAEFEAQIKGWKKAMEDYGTELAAWSNTASENIMDNQFMTKKPQEPMKPMSYLNDYDVYIELLEHNVSDGVEVDENEFEQIVKDNFGWRRSFQANSATYNAVLHG